MFLQFFIWFEYIGLFFGVEGDLLFFVMEIYYFNFDFRDGKLIYN